MERILRAVCVEMGSRAGVCGSPLSLDTCVKYGVVRSVSQAWRIGRAVAICRKTNNLRGVADAMLQLQNGRCLFVGKIIKVKREVKAGFTRGEIVLAPLMPEELESGEKEANPVIGVNPGDTLVIPFQVILLLNSDAYAFNETNPRTSLE